jgi:hypothetical protein
MAVALFGSAVRERIDDRVHDDWDKPTVGLDGSGGD